MKTKLLLLIIITCGFASFANADKYNTAQYGLLSAVDQNVSLQFQNQGLQNSSVTIDFSIKVGESWDAEHDTSNLIANCVTGNIITGIEWSNVTIETVGSSWLSEATILLSDSNNNQGVRLAIADTDGYSGSETYNSNGILDFTDGGVNDISALVDGKFPIQFFEQNDDVVDSIEAYYTSGTITIWGENLETDSNCAFRTNASADLKTSLTSNASAVININDEITFTLSVENIGDVAASNISITDSFYGLSYVEASCDDGSEGNANSRSMNVDNISVGSTLTCYIKTTVSDYGELSYTVSVQSENDIASSNNESQVLLRGPGHVIPVNNFVALFLLLFTILIITSRRIRALQ